MRWNLLEEEEVGIGVAVKGETATVGEGRLGRLLEKRLLVV